MTFSIYVQGHNGSSSLTYDQEIALVHLLTSKLVADLKDSGLYVSGATLNGANLLPPAPASPQLV